MAKHCAHSTGVGLVLGFRGGHDNVECCQCGAVGIRSYRHERVPLAGHGPYLRVESTVYDEPVWATNGNGRCG